MTDLFLNETPWGMVFLEKPAHLEGKVQLDDPLGVGVRHYVPLLPEEGRVRPLHHLELGQPLHGVHLAGGLVPHQLHLSKGAGADELDEVEVLDVHAQLVDLQGQGFVCNGRRSIIKRFLIIK